MTPPCSHPGSVQAYRDYVESVEEAPPMSEVKVYLAKIVQVARADNGEFLPIDKHDHIVVVDDQACAPRTEEFARSWFEQLVGGAEGGK